MAVSTLSKSLTANTSSQFFNLADLLQLRKLSTKQFTPTITYLTNTDLPRSTVKPSKISQWDFPTERPLSILLCWLMAKTRAVNKYTDFYLDKGFDVLTVRITPAQLLLPARTNRIIEQELMPLLRRSPHPQSVIHGFSVGGYVFAQMLRVAKENPEAYGPFLAKVQAQIWDSVADVQGTAIGVSKAVFPNAPLFQRLLKEYIDFHMKVMEPISTKHYYVAHEYFFNSPLPVPALFLNSENDPISPVSVIQAVQKVWKSHCDIPVTNKIWPNTPHVGHMQRHPDEYKQTVAEFLGKAGFQGAPRAVTDVRAKVEPEFSPAFNVLT